MRDILIASDIHAAHQWDTAETIEEKTRAVECIAQYAETLEDGFMAILNGDILHRPDDMEREGFNQEAAQRILRPLVEVLAAKEADVLYNAGNCDPWAGPVGFHRRIKKLFDPEHQLQKFQCGYWYQDDTVFATHGHILEPGATTIMREALPWPLKPYAAHRKNGLKLQEAMNDPDPAFAARLETEWSGHYKAYLIHAGINRAMSWTPAAMQKWMDDWKKGAWSRCHIHGACHAAAALPSMPKVVTLGHTHVPTLLVRDQLEELLGKGMALPEVYVNTGTATGDRGDISRFASISHNTVTLFGTDSPSRSPFFAVESAPISA